MATIDKGSSVSFIGSKDKSDATANNKEANAVYFTTDTHQIIVNGEGYGEEKLSGLTNAGTAVGYLTKSMDISGMTAMEILKKILFTTYAPKFTDASISAFTFKYGTKTGTNITSVAKDNTAWILYGTPITNYYIQTPASSDYTVNVATAKAGSYIAQGGAAGDPVLEGDLVTETGETEKHLNLGSCGTRTVTAKFSFSVGTQEVHDTAGNPTRKTASNETTSIDATSGLSTGNVNSEYHITTTAKPTSFTYKVYAPVFYSKTGNGSGGYRMDETSTFSAGQKAEGVTSAPSGSFNGNTKTDLVKLSNDNSHNFGMGSKVLQIKFQPAASGLSDDEDNKTTRRLLIPANYLNGKNLSQLNVDPTSWVYSASTNPYVLVDSSLKIKFSTSSSNYWIGTQNTTGWTTEQVTEYTNAIEVTYNVYKISNPVADPDLIAFKIG